MGNTSKFSKEENLMKQLNRFKQFSVLAFILLYTQYANAAFGQRVAQKLSEFNDELVIIAAVAFVSGCIMVAFNMFGGASERVKKWGYGMVVGALVCFFAPEISSFFFN